MKKKYLIEKINLVLKLKNTFPFQTNTGLEQY